MNMAKAVSMMEEDETPKPITSQTLKAKVNSLIFNLKPEGEHALGVPWSEWEDDFVRRAKVKQEIRKIQYEIAELEKRTLTIQDRITIETEHLDKDYEYEAKNPLYLASHNRIKIETLSETSSACPTQWEGKLADSREIYFRFRGGYLGIDIEGTYFWSSRIYQPDDFEIYTSKYQLRDAGLALFQRAMDEAAHVNEAEYELLCFSGSLSTSALQSILEYAFIFPESN